ncbi:hypothetical protein [Halovenus salina]|uniref:Uncharacterized protein n=1 Tax=Halovenus salina TaxID=1510225 RepID=A0ABD5W301_9EURY|nr:hypothetical protein [Halovenus salina]
MKMEDYIQAGESIYCQTKTKKPNTQISGELSVTGTRLIFIRNFKLSDSRITDIDLGRIDEIEYRTNPINYTYLLYALLAVLFSVYSGLIIPDIIQLPSVLQNVSAGIGLIMASALVIDAIYPRKPTLVIKTPSDSHTFKGGELGDFPHAIRGNAK